MHRTTSRNGHVITAEHPSASSSHPGSASVLLGTIALTLLIACAVIVLAASNSPVDPSQASAVILAGTTA